MEDESKSTPGSDGAADQTVEKEPEDIEIAEEELDAMDEDSATKVKSLSAQKAHWRDKAKKFETELAAARQAKVEKPKESPKKEATSALEERLARMELRQEFSVLDSEDIAEAMTYAKLKGISPSEAVKSPIFQATLNAKAEAKKADGATPPPSGRTGTGARNYQHYVDNPKDIAKMSPKEYEAFNKWSEEKGL